MQSSRARRETSTMLAKALLLSNAQHTKKFQKIKDQLVYRDSEITQDKTFLKPNILFSNPKNNQVIKSNLMDDLIDDIYEIIFGFLSLKERARYLIINKSLMDIINRMKISELFITLTKIDNDHLIIPIKRPMLFQELNTELKSTILNDFSLCPRIVNQAKQNKIQPFATQCSNHSTAVKRANLFACILGCILTMSSMLALSSNNSESHVKDVLLMVSGFFLIITHGTIVSNILTTDDPSGGLVDIYGFFARTNAKVKTQQLIHSFAQSKTSRT